MYYTKRYLLNCFYEQNTNVSEELTLKYSVYSLVSFIFFQVNLVGTSKNNNMKWKKTTRYFFSQNL